MDDGNVPEEFPRLEIFDHQESEKVSSDSLKKISACVVSECLRLKGPDVPAVLEKLEKVEVNLVSDSLISEVHEEFMEDPSPTDVITFQHGEIFISTDTAEKTAADHGHNANRETILYLIHSLLHLNGFDDRTKSARSRMEARQQEILQLVSPFPETENRG